MTLLDIPSQTRNFLNFNSSYPDIGIERRCNMEGEECIDLTKLESWYELEDQRNNNEEWCE